jgi:hypothetical protein
MQTTETVDKPESVVAVGSTDLLGCPWCGEKPDYAAAAQSMAHPQYGWPHTLTHNCQVVGNLCLRTDRLGIADTKEALFSAWNTRNQPNNAMSKSHEIQPQKEL